MLTHETLHASDAHMQSLLWAAVALSAWLSKVDLTNVGRLNRERTRGINELSHTCEALNTQALLVNSKLLKEFFDSFLWFPLWFCWTTHKIILIKNHPAETQTQHHPSWFFCPWGAPTSRLLMHFWPSIQWMWHKSYHYLGRYVHSGTFFNQ